MALVGQFVFTSGYLEAYKYITHPSTHCRVLIPSLPTISRLLKRNSLSPIEDLATDDRRETLADNGHSPPFHLKLQLTQRPSRPRLLILRVAWLVVLGAWCGLTASPGIYNKSGVFEVVTSKVLLPEDSPSSLGWIFSTYAFMNWVCGGTSWGQPSIQLGPRAVIIVRTICTLVGMFSLSICTSKIILHTILHASSIPC